MPATHEHHTASKESLIVVKIGGNILDDEQKLSGFLDSFAAVPDKKILVHGGGKLATRLAEQLGIRQQLIDGRRITDAETLKIVTMVYAGLINKSIVAGLQARGCHTLGFSGADGNLIRAHKRQQAGIDYGFAGDIDEVNASLAAHCLELGFSLVVAPITHNGEGQLLNTNADTIAQELAKALSEYYAVSLIYSFEKSGVLLDINNEHSVIPSITPAYYAQLRGEEKIFAGMIPKIDNAFRALDQGVSQVIIGKAEELDKLIASTAGTKITHG